MLALALCLATGQSKLPGQSLSLDAGAHASNSIEASAPGAIPPTAQAVGVGEPTRELTLSQALSLALANDFERERRARALRLSERSLAALTRRYLPGVSLSWQSYASRVTREDDTRDQYVRTDLTQLVWDGGQTALALGSAKAAALSEREALALYEGAFVHRVRLVYFEALRAKAALSLARRHEEAARQQATLAGYERAVGTLLETDRLLIVAEAKDATRARLLAEREVEASLEALRLACELDPREPFTVRGELEADLVPAPLTHTSERLEALGGERHPDFRKARLDSRRADDELRLARLGSFPVLSVGAYWQLGGLAQQSLSHDLGATLSFSSPFFGSSVQGSWGLASRKSGGALDESRSIKAGLFDDPRYFVAIEEKRLAAEAAHRAEDRLRREFTVRVRSAVSRLSLAWQELTLADETVAVLDRRLAALEVRVRLGEARRIDLAKDRNEAQAKHLARLSGRVAYARAAGELETLLALPADSLGLVKYRGGVP